MTIPRIKIFGERNTGTNYLAKLIDLNMQTQQLPGVLPPPIRKLKRWFPGDLVLDTYFFLTRRRNLGWKHACAPDAGSLRAMEARQFAVSFITITKNPFSWLLSLHKRPYHHESSRSQDFETFLKTPWTTVRRENAPKILSSPVDLWNLKNASYLALGNSDYPTINVRFEELLQDPQRVIEEICDKFHCPRRSSQFANIEESAKGHDKDAGFYRDYYLNERWRDKLSTSSIELINERLDNELMTSFGYQRL